MKVSEQEEASLVKDYEHCLEGYHQRDNLVQDEFFKFIIAFSVFLTLLLAINIFAEIHISCSILIQLILGYAGYLTLKSFRLDMQANTSCKVALRKRCEKIESQLTNKTKLTYWRTINNREKFPEEQRFKEKRSKGNKEQKEEGTICNIFIHTSNIFIVLWLIIVILNMVGSILFGVIFQTQV